MPDYRIEFRPSAARALRKLPRDVQRRIGRAIDGLGAEPRPQGARKLSGVEGLWRLRVGEYRVVYAIEDKVLAVFVVRLAHRREVYRR